MSVLQGVQILMILVAHAFSKAGNQERARMAFDCGGAQHDYAQFRRIPASHRRSSLRAGTDSDGPVDGSSTSLATSGYALGPCGLPQGLAGRVDHGNERRGSKRPAVVS
jgi:hypothetical protein